MFVSLETIDYQELVDYFIENSLPVGGYYWNWGNGIISKYGLSRNDANKVLRVLVELGFLIDGRARDGNPYYTIKQSVIEEYEKSHQK